MNCSHVFRWETIGSDLDKRHRWSTEREDRLDRTSISGTDTRVVIGGGGNINNKHRRTKSSCRRSKGFDGTTGVTGVWILSGDLSVGDVNGCSNRSFTWRKCFVCSTYNTSVTSVHVAKRSVHLHIRVCTTSPDLADVRWLMNHFSVSIRRAFLLLAHRSSMYQSLFVVVVACLD